MREHTLRPLLSLRPNLIDFCETPAKRLGDIEDTDDGRHNFRNRSAYTFELSCHLLRQAANMKYGPDGDLAKNIGVVRATHVLTIQFELRDKVAATARVRCGWTSTLNS